MSETAQLPGALPMLGQELSAPNPAPPPAAGGEEPAGLDGDAAAREYVARVEGLLEAVEACPTRERASDGDRGRAGAARALRRGTRADRRRARGARRRHARARAGDGRARLAPAAAARAAPGARRGARARRAGGRAPLPRIPRRQRAAARGRGRRRASAPGGQLLGLPVLVDDAQARDRGRDLQGRARRRGGAGRGRGRAGRCPIAGLLQIEVVKPAAAPSVSPGVWAMAGGMPQLSGGGVLLKEVSGESVLFLRPSERVYAYRPELSRAAADRSSTRACAQPS